MSLPFDKTLIIVPTYNESDNIEKLVAAIVAVSPQISILVVDDNSPDGTAKLVESLRIKFRNLNLLSRSGKLGLGTAYVAGFRWALEKKFEYIFEMDCDFSHDPTDIVRLLEAAQQNDLAIGSRYIEGIRVINWAVSRLLLSLFASFYTRLITRMPLKDPTGGYKCFKSTALKKIDLNRIMFKGYAFQIELNFKLWAQGLKIKEVPIIFYERREGKSKMNRSLVVEACFGVIRLKLRQIFGRL